MIWRQPVAVVALGLLGGGIEACRGPKPLPPPTPYHVCLSADRRLNWYDEQSHALFVRIYQLSSLDGFQQAQVGTLLEGGALPGQEGAVSERTISPGEDVGIEVLRRPEALYLGIVAGYYRLEGIGKAHLVVEDLEAEEPCDELDEDEGNWLRLGANGIVEKDDGE